MSDSAVDNINIDQIYTSLITCLQQYAKGMRDLQYANFAQRKKITMDVSGFIDSISSVSSLCAFKWAFINHNDYIQLQEFLDELINDKYLKLDLQQTKAQEPQQTVQKPSQTSPQLRAALEEKDDKTYKAHKANVDSMPHDKMRSLGDFMEGLLTMHYLVPLEEDLYKGTSKKPVPKEHEDNSYDDLLRSKFGNTIYQPPKR